MNACILLEGELMAQILKEEVRNAILDAATQLIVKNDLNEVTMRQIALASNMTVGNLYRYYPSKEELVKAIYEPFLSDLNKVLALYSNDQIALFQKTVGLKIDDLLFVIENITTELVRLYMIHADRMNVIMQSTEFGQSLLDWFSTVLKSLAQHAKEDVYYEMLSVSIFSGLGFIFSQQLEEETLKLIIYRYLSQMITL